MSRAMNQHKLFLAYVLAATCAFGAIEVRQEFRPERFTRGNVNLRVLQPIDKAAWIGPKGGAMGK